MHSYLTLTSFLCLAILTQCTPETKTAENTTADLVIGTFTDTGSKGIYLASFDTKTGNLGDLKLMAETSNPAYLTISADRQFVYSVNENDSGLVSSFKWDHSLNTLSLLNQVSSAGTSPCYIDLNESKNILASANYMTGNLAIYKVDNGKIAEEFVTKHHSGTGPNTSRQEGPHAHCSIFSKDGAFLYVVDLGIDKIMSYPIDSAGNAGEGQVALQLEGGDGPRHLTLHPEKDLAFVVNELSSTVVSLKSNPLSGTFEPISRISTLPDDFTGHNQCADIHLSADSKFLYVSNRGHNSIAIFSVSDSGELAFVGTESTRGDWPRNFVLSPDGQFMLVANQNSNSIVVFKVDTESGLLSATGAVLEAPKPVCLKF